MRSMHLIPVLTLCLTAALGGCDLVPVADMYGFCETDANGDLIITIENRGSENAGPSTTVIEFWIYDWGTWTAVPVELPTPALLPGEHVHLSVPFTPGCFDPDCYFTIYVDAYGELVEENEDNNIADGFCLG